MGNGISWEMANVRMGELLLFIRLSMLALILSYSYSNFGSSSVRSNLTLALAASRRNFAACICGLFFRASSRKEFNDTGSLEYEIPVMANMPTTMNKNIFLGILLQMSFRI